MVGEEQLRALPRTAFVLNPARGPIIQEQALLRRLREGWIAGAALDTHFAYPLPAGASAVAVPERDPDAAHLRVRPRGSISRGGWGTCLPPTWNAGWLAVLCSTWYRRPNCGRRESWLTPRHFLRRLPRTPTTTGRGWSTPIGWKSRATVRRVHSGAMPDGAWPRTTPSANSPEEWERKLRQAHKSPVAMELPTPPCKAGYRRGFANEVELTGRQYLTQAGRLGKLKLIRRLRLTRCQEVLTQGSGGAPSGVLHRFGLWRQQLGGCRSPDACPAPTLANLTFLNLVGNPIRDVGLAALAVSPYLGKLQYLNVGCQWFGSPGLQALLNLAGPGQLDHPERDWFRGGHGEAFPSWKDSHASPPSIWVPATLVTPGGRPGISTRPGRSPAVELARQRTDCGRRPLSGPFGSPAEAHDADPEHERPGRRRRRGVGRRNGLAPSHVPGPGRHPTQPLRTGGS